MSEKESKSSRKISVRYITENDGQQFEEELKSKLDSGVSVLRSGVEVLDYDFLVFWAILVKVEVEVEKVE